MTSSKRVSQIREREKREEREETKTGKGKDA